MAGLGARHSEDVLLAGRIGGWLVIERWAGNGEGHAGWAVVKRKFMWVLTAGKKVRKLSL